MPRLKGVKSAIRKVIIIVVLPEAYLLLRFFVFPFRYVVALLDVPDARSFELLQLRYSVLSA